MPLHQHGSSGDPDQIALTIIAWQNGDDLPLSVMHVPQEERKCFWCHVPKGNLTAEEFCRLIEEYNKKDPSAHMCQTCNTLFAQNFSDPTRKERIHSV